MENEAVREKYRPEWLSARLRELRLARRLSQAALSKVAGVSQQAIADAETGTYPRWDIVCALCDALGITLDVLAGQPSGERPEPIDRWANRRKREVEEG
jgi:transcriptional regulator with XRE-family HTH domain